MMDPESIATIQRIYETDSESSESSSEDENDDTDSEEDHPSTNNTATTIGSSNSAITTTRTSSCFKLIASPEATTIKSLTRNNPDYIFLQLWLTSSTPIRDFIDALWVNHTVEEACFQISTNFSLMQPEREILLLFLVVGKLPQLTKLYFNTLFRFPESETPSLSIRSLTNVFRSNRRLVELKLWRMELFASTCSSQEMGTTIQEQIIMWSNALRHSRCLQQFQIIKCKIKQEDEETEAGEQSTEDDNSPSTTICYLDPILQALGECSSLQTLEISATHLGGLGSLSQEGLTPLLTSSSSSLETFSIHNLLLSDETAAIAIANGLIPRTDPNNNNHIHHNSINPLYPQRRYYNHQNQNHNHSHNPHNHHNRIKHLKLTGVGKIASTFPKPIREAFRKALHENYCLESVLLFDPYNLRDEIRFYTKLNRYGRYRLMMLLWHEDNMDNMDNNRGRGSTSTSTTHNKEEWVETLISIVDDLDCLFYFLSINPLLCRST